MTTYPTIPGVVVVRSKVYEGLEPPTPWRKQLCSVEGAARLLGWWATLYQAERLAQTERGARGWFRDGHDINLLVEIEGATPAQLRAAWKGREGNDGN